MHSALANIIKKRSFDHKGRIYDIIAVVEPAFPNSFVVEATCNGKGIYYDYPDGFRTTQKQEVTLEGATDMFHARTMNAVDYTMDNVEKLVRTWVA